MRLTWRKVGVALVAGLGLWAITSGTAFAEEGPSTSELAVAMNTFFLFICATLVFFMQAGFAMLTAGLTRSKNTANILFKNLMDFVMCSIAFWAIGWGIAYGTSAGGFIGTDQFFLGVVTEEGSVPTLASCSSRSSSPERLRPSSPARWPSGRSLSLISYTAS